jgi:hypothetical protein
MRTVALTLLLATSLVASGQQTANSRLQLPLAQRLDAPLKVGSASVKLSDFVGFIATIFKVPLLVETTSPVPDVTIPAGTFSARQLLDIAVHQMRGYKWQSESGVAHIFQPELASAIGNLLNVKVDRYYFPQTLADFDLEFRACIHTSLQGLGCLTSPITGVIPAWLSHERLPYLEPFRNVTARTILLKALAANGHFYVLIAFEGRHPKRTSDFPFLNWFTQSLVPDEPSAMRVQRPNGR